MPSLLALATFLLAGFIATGHAIVLVPECTGVIARTDAGLVCGERLQYRNTFYASFKGVPYAKQPLGQLRFQELQPAEPWSGYMNATTEGPVCPQSDIFYGDLMTPSSMSEACIHANIYVPLGDEDSNKIRPTRALQTPAQVAGISRKELPVGRINTGLPIFVFIHGGGFGFGSSDSDLHGPEFLIENGVIVITFNYRLGPFGFLSLNSSFVPGNAGLRDMVTLLRWVRRNAMHFGGNPDDVTLAGQSAGSAAAHLLSLSKATEGLFNKVILMSGSAVRSFLSTSPAYADFIGKAFLTKLGITSDDPEQVHRELIDTPLELIMLANKALQDLNGLIAFTPVVETRFPGVTYILDKSPEELVAEGRGKDLPLLVGFTETECETFRPRLEEIDIAARVVVNPLLVVPVDMIFSYPSELLPEKMVALFKRYFPEGPTTDRFIKYCTDSYFQYPAIHTAEMRLETGGAPVYLYEFAFQGQHRVFERPSRKLPGASHAEDLTYIFKTNSRRDIEPLSIDDAMQHWMTRLFTNFILYGAPAGSDYSPMAWPPLNSEYFKYQHITRPSYSMRRPSLEISEMVRFYDELYSRHS